MENELSKWFTLDEFKFSVLAKTHGINNEPDELAISNMKILCKRVLDPCRDCIGEPLYINSGFRCEQLNRIVGGAPKSFHIQGCAADVYTRSVLDVDILRVALKAWDCRANEVIWYPKKKIVHIAYSMNSIKRYFGVRY